LPERVLRATQTGLRIAVRLSPRAAADRVIGIADTAGGGAVLKVAVSAPAQDGRANEALLRLLARSWAVPRRDLTIVAGTTSRNKEVAITGDGAALLAQLGAALARLPAR
jgi:uncharacterized protein (TIGR00251 family)